jgi:hypothetical protein
MNSILILKTNDDSGQTNHLKNLIIFENEISEEEKENAK